MKIERISDKQIRCKLTKEDLAARQIKISELAYGSPKARELFHDMMVQAYKECGFTNEAGTPLMIEAIPDSGNSLTVVITKVDDPEELDTRFAKFSPTEERPDPGSNMKVLGADDVVDMFKRLAEGASEGADGNSKMKKAEKPSPAQSKPSGRNAKKRSASMKPELPNLVRAYHFTNLEDVIRAANSLRSVHRGTSSLYHLTRQKKYCLVVHQAGQSPERFNKVCNILSEYGKGENYTGAKEAHLAEHETTVAVKDAIEKLASLS